jgi:hypothetical protein
VTSSRSNPEVPFQPGGPVQPVFDSDIEQLAEVCRTIPQATGDYRYPDYMLDFRSYAAAPSQASRMAWISAGVGSQG